MVRSWLFLTVVAAAFVVVAAAFVVVAAVVGKERERESVCEEGESL